MGTLSDLDPNEAVVIVCSRIAEFPSGAPAPSVRGRCSTCFDDVWISTTSDRELERRPGSRVVCTVCAAAQAATTPDLEFGVLPSTLEAVRRFVEENR